MARPGLGVWVHLVVLTAHPWGWATPGPAFPVHRPMLIRSPFFLPVARASLTLLRRWSLLCRVKILQV